MQTATFGVWLKARRRELDLTRVQLASRVGCAEITLEKIERNQRRPSRQIAALLADALQLPVAMREPFVRYARGLDEMPMQVVDDKSESSTRVQPLTNLPAPLTSFVDRVSELAAVRTRLLQPDVRLLTLVGPPGIGKTRLSIQLGQTVREQFADGVWFVALAPVSDPALVLPAIAHLFDIVEEGANLLLDRLQAHLQARKTLLILDNFEHVLAAAPVVTHLLKACPQVKVIATSRVPLRVYGEQEYGMPALSLPPKGMRLSPQQLMAFDAIKLFVTRVQAFQPDFQLNPDTMQAVIDICARMDGLPLAVELAAVRLRRLTLPQLRTALHTAPLQTLAVAALDVEPRQRTLRNAIQWSYDLLNPAERIAFARLGVFVGGASTEAALAVCEVDDDAILHGLAEQNLLKRESESRWTMLEMIREFALETLAQLSGNAWQQAQQQHAEYFAHLFKPDDRPLDSVIDTEQHNARAALRWLLDHRHPRTGELTRFMSGYFDRAGLADESRRLLPEVLSAEIEMTPFTRSELLGSASINAWLGHHFEESLHYAQQALASVREIDDQPQIADHLSALARLYFEMDDCVRARQIATEAIEIGRLIQDPVQMTGALVSLGQAELTLGHVDDAEACFKEAYGLCQAPDWQQYIYAGLACMGMGEIALIHGDYETALEFLHEGLARCQAHSLKFWILDVLAGVIGIMPRRTTADGCRAAKIWGAAEALNKKMGWVNAAGYRRRTDALIIKARTRMNPRMFEAAWAEGRGLSLDEAIALAMESEPLDIHSNTSISKK